MRGLPSSRNGYRAGLLSALLLAALIRPAGASLIGSPRQSADRESAVLRVPLSGDASPANKRSEPAPTPIDLGIRCLKEGSLTQAILQFKAARDLNGQNPIPYEMLCTAYGARGDWDSALDYARSYCDLAPGNPNARLMMAWSTYQTGDLYEAKLQFDSLSQDLPDNSDLHNLLGMVLTDLRRYDDAEIEFKKAKNLDSDNACAPMNIVMIKLIKKQGMSAMADAQAIEQKYPQQVWAQSLYAYASACAGANDVAERAAGEALALNPADPLALTAKATVAINRGKPQQSIADLDQAIKTNGATAFLCSKLAEALYENHQYQQAVDQAQTALQLAPSNLEAKRWLAVALGAQGNWDAAVLYLREVSARQPKDLELKLLLGQAQEKRGDIEAAMDVFESASQAFPADARPVAALARVAMAQHDRRSARKLARRALQMDPGNHEALAVIDPKGQRNCHDTCRPQHDRDER